MSHCGDTTPASSAWPEPPRGQGTGAKGCVSWTQRPQEAGHGHTSQEDTQHRVSSSSNSRGGQGAADTLPETGRAPRTATQNCTPARPLWPRLAGRRRLKGDAGGLRLDFRPAAPAWRDVALQGGHQVVTFKLWPLAPPAPRQIFAPLKAITARSWHPHKRPVPRAVPLRDWPSRPGGSKGDSRAQRPGENRFNQESAQEESGQFSIEREEGSPRQAPQGAGHALEGRDRVINEPVT